MPKDSIYLPVHAGAAGKANISLSYQRDDEGENISLKNPNYCELTALYWLWKNSKAEYLGLAHYRRQNIMKFYLLLKKVNDKYCINNIENIDKCNGNCINFVISNS